MSQNCMKLKKEIFLQFEVLSFINQFSNSMNPSLKDTLKNIFHKICLLC